MADSGVVVAPEALARFCASAFQEMGVPSGDASLVADTLIQADLRNVGTHGVSRLRGYVDRLKAGGMVAQPRMSVISDGGATLLLDGGNGIGQVVAARAMGLVIERAKSHGIASVGVRNCNHVGALAYYPRMGLAENLICFAVSGSAPMMAPWGGLDKLLSTAPWSIAIPAGEELPIVVDFSCTSMNVLKAGTMAERGEELPPGIALAADGQPTRDPAEALKGVILPIGGHKGYGLMLALDVLSSLLTGANYSTGIPRPNELTRPQGIGLLMLALRIDRFMPVQEFKARVDDLIRKLKGSRRVPGVQKILIPGERSELLARQRLMEGIPLPAGVVQSLRGVAQELSLPLPF